MIRPSKVLGYGLGLFLNALCRRTVELDTSFALSQGKELSVFIK